MAGLCGGVGGYLSMAVFRVERSQGMVSMGVLRMAVNLEWGMALLKAMAFAGIVPVYALLEMEDMPLDLLSLMP